MLHWRRQSRMGPRRRGVDAGAARRMRAVAGRVWLSRRVDRAMWLRLKRWHGRVLSGASLDLQSLEPRVLLTNDLHAGLGTLNLPTVLVPGDKITVPATLINDGDTAAVGTVTMKLYASRDGTLDTGTDLLLATLADKKINLKANGASMAKFSFKATLPSDPTLLPTGDYQLFVKVEPGSTITDTNAANDFIGTTTPVPVSYALGVVNGRKIGKITLFDSNATIVTLSLSGVGSAVIDYVSGGFDIALSGTDAKSKLSITAKKSKIDGDDGIAKIINITTDGSVMGTIAAATSDLYGNLTASGGLVAATLHNLPAGDAQHALTFGTLVAPKPLTTLTLGQVNDTVVDSGTALKITAARWLDAGGDADGITAPSITGLAIKGDKKTATVGDFEADLALSGATAPALTLGPTTIAGSATGLWNITGSVGAVTAASFGAGFAANVSGTIAKFTANGDATGTLAAASITSFTVKGNLTNALILAGANLGADAAIGGGNDGFGAGSIGAFAVGGTVTNSTIGAGLDPINGVLMDGNDELVGNAATSFIKALKVGGTADATTTFAAVLYPAAPTIGGVKIVPASDARFFKASSPRDLSGPVLTVALTNDTAPNGGTNSDKITADPAVAGTTSDISGITTLLAGIDGGNPAFDITADLQSDGTFALNKARLDEIAGSTITDGIHTLKLRAQDGGGSFSDVLSLAFTLDTTAPSTPTLDLSLTSDSDTIGDQQTSAGKVTLAGTTEPGAKVQLLSGATVITSVTASGSGAFQIPGVSLTLGANAFTIKTSDLADNSTTFDRTLTRTVGSGATDVVITWDTQLLNAIAQTASYPTYASRAMAIESIAVYDTVQAIEGLPGYMVTTTAPAGANPTAAAAAAAHRVLVALFPARKAIFDAQLVNDLAAITDGQSETDGVTLGEAIADDILLLRANDGSGDYVNYSPGTAAGQWQQTGPAFDVALDPQWAYVTPFALTSPDEFRPPAPPTLTSQAYTDSLNEIKLLGPATGSTRTSDQTQIARFWNDGAGTVTPP
ncbi:MAG: hypothetical protein K8S99_14140, partial [Planctomycetes bacterium]|nr:hypothetical protein [Planctomycetota bacterium]